MKALLSGSNLVILCVLLLSISSSSYSLPTRDVSSYSLCSQIPDTTDREYCQNHKQSYHSSIVKVPAGTQNLETVLTIENALYIFDGAVGRTQVQAVYKLPYGFTLPLHSAMVGNNPDTKAEFVVDVASSSAGTPSGHYVLTVAEQGYFRFDNVEFDSRNPTQPSLEHSPQGVLNLEGALSVVLNKVKVVSNRASSSSPVQAVRLGCNYFQTWTSTYRINNSEFDLTTGMLTPTSELHAAFISHNRCSELFEGHDVNGQVLLNMEDTTTTILVGDQAPGFSTGFLFDIAIGSMKTGVFQFIQSENNRVIDQSGNDISSTHMGTISVLGSDPDRHLNDHCTGFFGIGSHYNTRFWGWRPYKLAEFPTRFSAGFAPSEYWSANDYNVRCHTTITASLSALMPLMAVNSSSEADSGKSRTVEVSGKQIGELTFLGALFVVVYTMATQAVYWSTDSPAIAIMGCGLPYLQLFCRKRKSYR